MYSRSRFINGPSSLAFVYLSKKTNEEKLCVEIYRRSSFSNENPGVSYFRQNYQLSLDFKAPELQSQVFLVICARLRMVDVIHSNDKWTDFDIIERGEKLIFMPADVVSYK